MIEPGVTVRPVARRRTGPVRFLFVSADPFRDGVRLLLEAWNRVGTARAELLCIVPD